MNFENFSIRLLRSDDLHEYYQLIDRNRPRLEEFFSGTVARTRTFEDAQAYLAEIIVKAELKTYMPFVLIDRNRDSLIGFMDLKNIDWNIPRAELGCFIDEQYAGRGLTSTAFALFCDHCFDVLGIRKLFLRTHQSNIPARRLAEKCGFEVEGILRRDYKTTAGELVDLMYYGRISEN